MNEHDMRNTATQGKFYNPASLHYPNMPNVRITCDRCHAEITTCCIGHREFDLCMPCVTTITAQTKNTGTGTLMQQSQFAGTRMQQAQFSRGSGTGTKMQQAQFSRGTGTKMQQSQFTTNMRQSQFTGGATTATYMQQEQFTGARLGTLMMQSQFTPTANISTSTNTVPLTSATNSVPVTYLQPGKGPPAPVDPRRSYGFDLEDGPDTDTDTDPDDKGTMTLMSQSQFDGTADY